MKVFTRLVANRMYAGIRFDDGSILHEWHLSTYAKDLKKLRAFMRYNTQQRLKAILKLRAEMA